MPDIDFSSGTGIGTAVAFTGWLFIQSVLKPLLSAWGEYDSWKEVSKTAVWSGVVAIGAGIWAGIALGSAQEVFVAVTVALVATPGIHTVSKFGRSTENGG